MEGQRRAVIVSRDQERAVDLEYAVEGRGIEGTKLSSLKTLPAWLEPPNPPHLAIIDLSLDGLDELDSIAEEIDLHRELPVTTALLSENQSEELSRAFDLGVDFPLVGPVPAHIVCDTVINKLDRIEEELIGGSVWSLDVVAWKVMPPGGNEPVPLTFKEREFLLRLAQTPGYPVRKECFADLFNTTAELFDPRRLEIMVRRLRSKVREQAKEDLPVHTAHGLGYALSTFMTVNPPPTTLSAKFKEDES